MILRTWTTIENATAAKLINPQTSISSIEFACFAHLHALMEVRIQRLLHRFENLKYLTVISAFTLLQPAAAEPLQITVPESFPRFEVPGQESQMQLLRELHWLHYAGCGPKATLWDAWLVEPGLWPAIEQTTATPDMRREWREELSSRTIMQDGYVATHQHKSIAHQQGWPFPFWTLSPNTYGWHFSFKDTVGADWRPPTLSDTTGWALDNITSAGIDEDGWQLMLDAPDAHATITPQAKVIRAFEAPFMQIRWQSRELRDAQPYLEWSTKDQPEFHATRRIYFSPPGSNRMVYTMVSMFHHPQWTGEITRLRLGFGNPRAARVCVQALFTQYDTRHNINNHSYVDGCIEYFWWTRDLNFLRRNLDRMRVATRYIIEEGKLREQHVYVCDWIGHDGRTGVVAKDGKVETRHGHGIGSNYWDLLPFGARDAYATLRSYSTLRKMAQLEDEVGRHPDWNIPASLASIPADELREISNQVQEHGNREFWTSETGRFVACIDADGKSHDYGLTFLNLEAIYYGFATPGHSQEILEWLDGKRIVNDDTSTGPDIYHWRFGPRSSTRRNLDWYAWVWNAPHSIPFGNQVQDGGAVLGWTYHDLVSRLRIKGPDDAAERLKQIMDWFAEVKAAGGYRAYYNGTREGTLQGGNVAGGLGFDQEFFESALLPQIMLHGFMGFRPTGVGFAIHPRLPTSWPSLRINNIAFHNQTLDISATSSTITIQRSGLSPPDLIRIVSPNDEWSAAWADNTTISLTRSIQRSKDWLVDWSSTKTLVLSKQ
ncbi:MAG: glycosyl hydrolase family 65 protein [Candidatus Sumerlaeaceae bacterium]